MQGQLSRLRGALALLLTIFLIGCASSEGSDAPPRTPAEPAATCIPDNPPTPADSTDIASNLATRGVEDVLDPTPCLVLEDLDGDGALDLVIGDRNVEDRQPGIRIFWSFDSEDQENMHVVFAENATPSAACTPLDLDGDSGLELLVGTEEGTVWQIDGLEDRTLTPALANIELPEAAPGIRLIVATLVDLDRAGPPDLILGGSNPPILPCVTVESDPGGGADVQLQHTMNPEGWLRCYTGTPEGGFIPADDLCPEFPPALYLGAAVADVQGDELPDVLVVIDFGTNRVLFGDAQGGLIDATEGAGLIHYNHGMGAVFTDLTGRGTQDLYITDLGPDQLYRATGCGIWEEVGLSAGIAEPTDRAIGWGVAAGDLDRDGDVDLFVGNSMVMAAGGFAAGDVCQTPILDVPQYDSLLVQEPGGAFAAHALPHPGEFGGTWSEISVAMGDLGGDGDLDILSSQTGQVVLRENGVEPAGDYLMVRPVDNEGRPVSGATVTVVSEKRGTQTRRIDAGTGFSGHHAQQALFGLGWDDVITEVRVRWPHGQEHTESGVAPGTHIIISPPQP